MKITTIDKDVKELLSSHYFVIPRFQRPYSWDKSNVEDFLNDVVTESDSDYFIGSIVCFKEGKSLLGIVDGQQRLTTITMILCALRDCFEEHDLGDSAAGIHTLIERRNIDNRAEFVLKAESSYPYLHHMIQTQPSSRGDREVAASEEETTLQDSYTTIGGFLQSEIRSINDDVGVPASKKKVAIAQRLSSIRDRVLQLKCIYIELDSEDDAYTVFETLNTRGKDLRVSDLVKNHILRLVRPSNKELDKAKDKWGEILRQFDECAADIELDTYLHHYWLSQYEFLPLKKLYKSFKVRIKNRSEATKELEKLASDGEIYRWIHEPSAREWAIEQRPIRNAIDALLMFRVRQPVPFVLSVAREWQGERIKGSVAARALKALEDFHFSFTALTSQRSSGGISAMYALHARRLCSSQDPNAKAKEIADLVKKLKERLPSYEEWELGFRSLIYGFSLQRTKKLVQYVLRKLDEHWSKRDVPDYQLLTVEHIAPQSSHRTKRGSRGMSIRQIVSIGNLILVGKELNEKLASKPFMEKKKILIDNGVITEKDDVLYNADQWTENEIRRRTESLARIGYEKIWTIS